MREITIPGEKITSVPLLLSKEGECQYCHAEATHKLIMPMNSLEKWITYACEEHNKQFLANGYTLVLTGSHDID